jgi:hydrogenase expression/formation protein HypC
MCLAIPGKVASIEGSEPLTLMAKIDFGGVIKQASLACVPGAQVGDYVIVHAGFAIGRLDESEATKVFEYLKEIEELGDLSDNQAGVDSE